MVTGDDFTFGKGRGAMSRCSSARAEHGVIAEAVAPVLLDGKRISSGRIREALQAGDTATATHLLSRDFAIEGIVQRGDARGRSWLSHRQPGLGDYLRPRYGSMRCG